MEVIIAKMCRVFADNYLQAGYDANWNPTCFRGGVNGISYPTYGIASSFNLSYPADELRTIVHEFGHLFGALDHYGIGSVPSSNDMGGNYDPNCIYGENKEEEDVTNELMICGGCQAAIEKNVGKYTP